ncbi:hypothetical protein [Burkholderia sp. Bp8998]|uniref:hypothetical protein n=1 Tax=Burkholderia sp. Bp8998 TaxID=2184557 RepID=UPI000F59B98F|nr:hypothetical protein [Burkholderia sp. Bp8998]RQS19401.1 hypothetical protein DIE06_12255 [Burkholderia sp. Bp8998]
MEPVIITTVDELKHAQKSGVAEFLVTGELADKLKKTRTIMTLGPVALAALGAVAVAAIPTGGMSTVGFLPIATLTGMEAATIFFIAVIGLTVVLALYKDYDAEFTMKGARFTKKR